MKKSFLILVALLLFGCVEPIVLDPGEKDLPVMVYCVLKNNIILGRAEKTVQTLNLMYVKGKSQADYIPVVEATVYLEGDEKKIPFAYKDGDLWETEAMFIKSGVEYVLKIEIPGRGLISAKTQTIQGSSFDVRRLPLGEKREPFYQVFAEFQFWEDAPENEAIWVTAGEQTGPSEEDTEQLIYLTTNYPHADGFNIMGKRYSELSFRGTAGSDMGKMYESIFNFAKKEIADYPLYDKFVRIGNFKSGESFFIVPGPLFEPRNQVPVSYFYNGSPDARPWRYSFLNVYCVPEEYDKYLREVYTKSKSLEHDLTSAYDTSNLHSNIEGGVGIFTNCDVYKMPFLQHDEIYN